MPQSVEVGEREGVLLCVALKLGDGVPVALKRDVAEAVRVPAPAAACCSAGVGVKEGRSREALGEPVGEPAGIAPAEADGAAGHVIRRSVLVAMSLTKMAPEASTARPWGLPKPAPMP